MVKIVVTAWFDPKEAEYVGGNCFQSFDNIEDAKKFLDNQIKDRIEFAKKCIKSKNRWNKYNRLVRKCKAKVMKTAQNANTKGQS
jgi:hypothetical protein